jgi:hypothetical protein
MEQNMDAAGLSVVVENGIEKLRYRDCLPGWPG